MCQIGRVTEKVLNVKQENSILAYKVVKVQHDPTRGVYYTPLFANRGCVWRRKDGNTYKSHIIPSPAVCSRTGFHAFRTVRAAARAEGISPNLIVPVWLWGRVVLVKADRDNRPAGYRAQYMRLA